MLPDDLRIVGAVVAWRLPPVPAARFCEAGMAATAFAAYRDPAHLIDRRRQRGGRAGVPVQLAQHPTRPNVACPGDTAG
jgi:hypothetical protein